MPTVWIPPLLQDLTGGQPTVRVPGATVAEVIEALDHAYPGLKGRVMEEGRLIAGLAVAVDSRVTTRGVGEPVGEGSEIHFLPALGGGG